MKNQNNPSINVEFIDLPKLHHNDGNKFGTLAENKAIAFNPETTGASILAESNVRRQVADERDMLNFKSVFISGDAEPEMLVQPSAADSIIAPDRIRGQGMENDEIRYERVIDLPDFLPAWFFRVGAQRAKAVCKIEASGVDYKGVSGAWSGTGFLISANILLTNHHVLNSKEVASKAICIFNYETDENGKVLKTETFTLEPDKLFITSPAEGGLDFTACWIESGASEQFGFVPVFRHSFAIKNEDCANIVQHPDGRHKSVVVQKNEVYQQTDTVVHYTSDTEPGSSGAFVCNNSWKLVALHHASRRIREADFAENIKAVYMNEGIKMAAIATYLESLSDTDRNYNAARQVLEAFNGVDSAMGYFGSLGRHTSGASESDLEVVRNSYRGEAKDLDLCFWNIEWFNKNYKQKLKDVAWEISVQNLDIWVLSESSPEAATALVEYLKAQYDLDYDWVASEPDAPSSKQTTTVIWNTRTASVVRKDWPEKADRWLRLNSSDFKDLHELEEAIELEAVDGKIFDRYPGLFYVTAINPEASSSSHFAFNLVPLHLKAMSEGSKRRRFACKILAQAIDYCIKHKNFDDEWILGGDLNATLASGDLEELSKGSLIALSAEDAKAQAFSYLKKPYQSLIDHIYLSPNLVNRTDPEGFMILARERDNTRDGNPKSDYLSISDHRPIMVRLSLVDPQQPKKGADASDDVRKKAAAELAGLISSEPSNDPVGLDSNALGTREEALEILERSRNRIYYDKIADDQNKASYYSPMPTFSDPDKLFRHFHDLVRSTHSKPLPYKPALYVYPWVDLQPDLQLVNLYNGAATTPEILIEADFEIEESEFEGNAMFNCEHVVPQSWFDKRSPQRGDLHHLFACTPNCNSFRGNIPYIEFPDWEEKTMADCGKRETEGFEPKRSKGIVARATLYFMLRYPNDKVRYTGSSFANLLAWNLEEPPGEYEFHRNAAIQELQGNRNPFIDFPKLATQLNFRRSGV
ncbi:endonuclease [Desertivirga brevis]|uniref:endonuclease n=1 Tax=Desertivirga brevis TaxID=2810310 RepID=UPI001A971399|nr:endonuclease [Pedobacter sp. SYSU D00873]